MESKYANLLNIVDVSYVNVLENGEMISSFFHFSTPLYCAAFGGAINTTKYLVEQGANVKATNKEGKTPLDYALEEEHEDVAQYLKKMTQSD